MPTPAPRPTNSAGEKLAQRVSHILALLHQGDTIDKHQLAQTLGVNVRTIERDLNLRLQGFAERNAEGRWQLTESARSTIPASHLHHYAQLVGMQQLFPDRSLRFLLEQLKTPKHQRAVQVQPTPEEDLSAQSPHAPQAFAQLQNAIAQRHACRFTYKEKPRYAQPYRLIHKNGVWYLAAVEGERLKNFSVALMTELQVDEASHFTPEAAHQEYIDAKDDVWFTAATTEVLLRVSPEVAHYFNRRPLLPQQQQRADTDGSLLVTTHISHPHQLLPVVRYWLPHVRIVKPQEWHDELVQGLQKALAKWGV